jgi:O-antigen/teichoic acid export membrane protein
MSDIDKEIAEFHAAARKRKAVIFGVSGVLMLAIGIAVLLMTFLVTGGGDEDSGVSFSVRYPVKVIVVGIAFVLGGLTSCYNAYRVGSGQVNDVES